MHVGGSSHPTTDLVEYWGDASLNMRMGQRFQITYSPSLDFIDNNRGFVGVTTHEDTIYFAKRSIKTISNVVEGALALNNKASFKIRLRHYWSGVKNKDFYQLQNNGSLRADPLYSNKDENYNAFTLDMIFRWIFAPGSEMTWAWKNSIYDSRDYEITPYWQNLQKTLQGAQSNSISLKILYYIDYNSLKKSKI